MRVRESFRIRGLVQGVGFRPTLWKCAHRLQLAGEVYNDADGVVATVEGEEALVASFPGELRLDVGRDAPLARIDEIVSLGFEAPRGEAEFRITESRGGRAHTMVTPDAATCPACTAELFDRTNRRYRYAFINCTHCGPRHTITRSIPYDRPKTSMSVFPMCPACLAEYQNPEDRRFHAQPNACPVCGPALMLTDAGRQVIAGDPVETALRLIRAGKILAIKGLGGFHLVCDAKNPAAVAALRQRKERSEKALAVMVANAGQAQKLIHLSAKGLEALQSTARPIVLAPKTPPGENSLAQGVAAGYAELGIMLPYTPLHELLFFEAAGRPEGVRTLDELSTNLVLVMTSANPAGEPLVTQNDEAYARLGTIADAFLLHNREIVIRCDDSVVRDFGDAVRTVRRARGYTPLAMPFPYEAEPLVGLGPYLKNTVCVTRGKEAFVSEHIGDTDNEPTVRELEKTLAHFVEILEVQPKAVACDAHPDFPSTRIAESLAHEKALSLLTVQHHHAHTAAVAGECALSYPLWGLSLDGVGLGSDGTSWGGELLWLEENGTFERVSHLETMALPGFDKAAREPRRMGAVLAVMAGRSDAIETLWPSFKGQPIRAVIASPRLSGRTSSMGRLFDAASAVCGLSETVHDEAYAAMRLESEAAQFEGHVLKEAWKILPGGELSLRTLFARLIDRRLAGKEPAGALAADFEATLVAALLAWVMHHVKEKAGGERHPVALSGGCFLNRVLSRGILGGLRAQGLHAALPEKLPPGDGAVSYGQVLVAAQRLRSQKND